MPVEVGEERHPEVVILHGRDEVRLAGEGDPAPFKFLAPYAGCAMAS